MKQPIIEKLRHYCQTLELSRRCRPIMRYGRRLGDAFRHCSLLLDKLARRLIRPPDQETERYLFLGQLDRLARRGPVWSAHLLLLSLALFFFSALIWAACAELDEVARGVGRVIPSSQVQIVQNLEGGIVEEILVREGDEVAKDQLLLRLNKIAADAVFREKRSQYYDLLASVARLSAEAEDGRIRFPAKVKAEEPALVENETQLFNARRRQLRSAIQILQRQCEQREHEIAELKSQLVHLRQTYQLAQEELAITAPMVEKGATSRVEMLRLQRDMSGLEGRLEQTELAIPKAESALAEARRRIVEERERFRSKVIGELKEKQMRLAALSEAMPALEDKVVRTDVRSPVKGTVKQLFVNTPGGVVASGMRLAEVVPKEDHLLVEARVLPADIAFIHPGQSATVKLTAYDFAIYGGLDGKVEHISADSIVDEDGQSYYQIRVRTENGYLGREEHGLPIMPGMIAQVDILTGKKTVLDYLLKPLLKTKQNALRER